MEEDELDNRIPSVAPKVSTPADTLASAPSPLAPASHNSSIPPGMANTAPSGKVSTAPARPALSEVRPYSSASSGYRPELVAQYANKHGKKPLPMPAVSGTVSGSMPPAMVPMGAPFGQTMLPGQFAMGQPNQFGTMANGTIQHMAPVPPPMSGIPGHPPQPMGAPQQPQLMNLFSPPNTSDMTMQSKVLPQPPEPVPAFNPAYVGASTDAQSMSAAPPAPAKVLPQPPVAPNGRATSMGFNDQAGGYPTPNHLPQMQFQNDSMMFVPDSMMANAGGFVPGGAAPVPMMVMQGQPQMQQMTAAPQMQAQQIIYGTMQPQMQAMYQPADMQMQMMQPQMMYQPGIVPDPSAPPMMMSYENLQFSQPNFQQPQQVIQQQQQPLQQQPLQQQQFNPAAYGMQQQQYYP
ncbi:hypothetical protein FBU59_000493 [Linderina macrospora]|uniref:Uncharacterized protein n=1 Tax=Linderina macrospora TaxID=4868 RepID=A0ACC1JGG8_9FUNG|nr:hypothetical protein FBU59_000493 [Linderina macrospora]